jgi:type VI secretion system secreted protein Hcp
MAQKFYMTIKGIKQGTIKGGSTRHHSGIEVSSFSMGVQSPLDAGTGQATGRRQHNPVIIVRETDSASPLLYQALVSNETLKSVSLSFARPSAGGKEED